MFLEKNYCSEGKMFKIENAMKTSKLVKRRKLDENFIEKFLQDMLEVHFFHMFLSSS